MTIERAKEILEDYSYALVVNSGQTKQDRELSKAIDKVLIELNNSISKDRIINLMNEVENNDIEKEWDKKIIIYYLDKLLN